ncbi:hypothetical protein ACFOPX_03765 [Helicobacter baculiformis]|uniref:Uncharacterized protein n=1 Tax=Helicobacter baculiformis TaxID=427351 RepID=A0ABV7ZKF1_9HELI|nr:hypothetical protein [Helicobacter baculiformis]
MDALKQPFSGGTGFDKNDIAADKQGIEYVLELRKRYKDESNRTYLK